MISLIIRGKVDWGQGEGGEGRGKGERGGGKGGDINPMMPPFYFCPPCVVNDNDIKSRFFTAGIPLLAEFYSLFCNRERERDPNPT